MSWNYIDSTGNIQGPFPTSKIAKWIKDGHFPADIKIKKFSAFENSENDLTQPKSFIPIGQVEEFSKLFENTKNFQNFEKIEEKNNFFDKNLSKTQKMTKFAKKIDIEKSEKTKKIEEMAEKLKQKFDKNYEKLVKNKEKIVENKEKLKISKIDISNLGEKPKSKDIHWIYIDQNEKAQGPFSNGMMHFWFEEGHLKENLRVKKYDPSSKNNDDKNSFQFIKDIVDCEFLKKWEEKEKLNWFYIGKKGEENGPFKSKTMLKWLQRGFLPRTLPIRSDISTEFVPINRLFEPFGNDVKEKPCWHYKDDKGEEYGPFLTSIMALWFFSGFFSERIMCKNDSFGSQFVPLKIAKTHFTKTQEESVEEIVPNLKSKYKFQTRNNKSNVKWYFIDVDNEKEQGPFSEDAMRSWHEQGFMPDFIKVRREGEREFREIGSRSDCGFLKNPQPVFKSPFFENIVDFEENEKWLYFGQNQIEQGPFSTQQMRNWFFQGMLPPHLLVRKTTEPLNSAIPLVHRDCSFKRMPFSQNNIQQNSSQNLMPNTQNISKINQNNQILFQNKQNLMQNMPKLNQNSQILMQNNQNLIQNNQKFNRNNIKNRKKRVAETIEKLTETLDQIEKKKFKSGDL